MYSAQYNEKKNEFSVHQAGPRECSYHPEKEFANAPEGAPAGLRNESWWTSRVEISDTGWRPEISDRGVGSRLGVQQKICI